MTRITIQKLSKRFDQQTVLQDLSLVIPDGCFFTLLGPSGCGKTTLLRCLAGFNAADSGRILFDDQDITAVPAHQRNIGMVFQDYALFPDKSVFDNVAYGLRARQVPRAEVTLRAGEALEQVGLQTMAQRYPAQLSGGQRQRVALARALVIKPRLLLMDEPLSNLDAKLRLSMRDVISDLQRATRITTVFVTHDQEEALAMSDEIAVLQTGRVAQQGTPQALYATPQSAYVADFIGSANLLPVTVRVAGQVQWGSIHLPANTGDLKPSTEAKLVLRPEAVSVLSSPLPHQVTLPAKVVRSQYLGAKTMLRLRLQNDHELQVEQAGASGLRLGDAVHIDLGTALRAVPA
jgi:iron(III) transport system ATP-binding protein